ncbi:MAG: baseplate J/gp47 family protein [Anaerolineales bacterium]|nr:baseplate J/gp47 family protein [Anaerolineales bacterium]
MKTKIITLESHDDLISVRDRLSWAKTPRILLVWSKYEKVTLRLLDLKVLQRHADSLGAQLGLVTRRANVRRDAESLGIPVFKSTVSAQKEPWAAPAPRTRRIPPPPRRGLRQMRDEAQVQEPAWRTSLLGRVVAFTAGVMAVLVLAGLFVPRAALTLYPETQTQSILIPVSASASVNSVSVTGSIPAQVMSVTVDAEQSQTVTREISIPRAKAQGIAQFKNLTTNEIEIPAGTVIATDSVTRFVTLNNALLPAGVNEIVEVRVEALSAGSQGNVETDEIKVVEGALGLSMTVTNPEPTTGGTDTRAVGATDADRLKLRDAVLSELRDVAESQLRAQIEAGDMLLLDTLEVEDILLEEFSPPENEAGRTLMLKMEVEISARFISASDLSQLASMTLGASTPQGFVPLDELTFSPRAEPVTDEFGVTHFELEVTQTAVRELDAFRVFSLIRGLDPSEARSALMNAFSLRAEPQIIITPSWWKWLPLIPFNLSVIAE